MNTLNSSFSPEHNFLAFFFNLFSYLSCVRDEGILISIKELIYEKYMYIYMCTFDLNNFPITNPFCLKNISLFKHA